MPEQLPKPLGEAPNQPINLLANAVPLSLSSASEALPQSADEHPTTPRSNQTAAKSLEDLSRFMRNREHAIQMKGNPDDMPSWLQAFLKVQLSWQDLMTQRLDQHVSVLDHVRGEVQDNLTHVQGRLQRLEKHFGLPEMPAGSVDNHSGVNTSILDCRKANSCISPACHVIESRSPPAPVAEEDQEIEQLPAKIEQIPNKKTSALKVPAPTAAERREDMAKKKFVSFDASDTAQMAELDESKVMLSSDMPPKFDAPPSPTDASTNNSYQSDGDLKLVRIEQTDEDDPVRMNSITSSVPSSLPESESETHVFKLKDAWADAAKSATRVKQDLRLAGVRTRDALKAPDQVLSADVLPSGEAIRRDTGRKTPCHRLVINPNSPWRFVWDLFGMGLIGFDIVTIPLQFFNMMLPLWFQYLTCLFWTSDMCFGFFLGWYNQGVLEMRLRYVVLHYCRTWMIFDVAIVTADWYVVVLGRDEVNNTSGTDPTLARIGKSLRIVRTLRSLRLLRLVKMKRIVEAIKDRLISEVSRTLFNVFSLIVLIVAINHVIACAWYGIGHHHQSLGYPNWVEAHGFNETHFDYTYISALHWSLTQFTPATMEVFPQNTSERFFTVLVLLFALVVFGSFVSSLTSAMTRFHSLRSERDRQFELLRRFLRDMQVSHFLAVRVQRYLEYVVSLRHRRIEMSDVELLNMLSDPLRMDLDNEIYGPALSSHPFFWHYSNTDANAMRRICHTCLTRVFLCAGDSLFSSGDPCFSMYFVLDGQLRYKPADPSTHEKLTRWKSRRASSFVHGERSEFMAIKKFKSERDDKYNSRTSQHMGVLRKTPHDATLSMSNRGEDEDLTEDEAQNRLKAGDWCCEAALWTRWSHQGVMRAMTICDILVLDAAGFMAVTASHGRIAPHAGVYAEEFVKGLNDMAQDGVTSDLTIMDHDSFIKEAFHMTLTSWHLKSSQDSRKTMNRDSLDSTAQRAITDSTTPNYSAQSMEEEQMRRANDLANADSQDAGRNGSSGHSKYD